jgi:hypothetical protein
MFNAIISIQNLFIISLCSFFIFFTLRQLIKRSLFIVLYHITLFCILFSLAIGGGGVQNDGYERLEKFILLEKNNQLEHAKNNPQNYDSMLQIDIKEFKNSANFRAYLQKHDLSVDKVEAIFIGGLFALLTEISLILVWSLRRFRLRFY